MNNRRLLITIITGSILGVFCIIGANIRFGGNLENYYLFSFWLNRVLMGVVIGLLPPVKGIKVMVVRGIIVGLLISFTFYGATNFYDLTGFLVGAVYGIIIEFVAYKLTIKEEV